MTRTWPRLAMALVALVGSAAASHAQLALPSVYVQAGPAAGMHAEGDQYHRTSPPLKGTTVGGALAVGARFTRELGAEVAVSVDGKLSGPQADVYFARTDYTAESRDTVIDVNVRFRPRGGSRVEFSVGGGWAYTRFARRDQVLSSPFSPTTTSGIDSETSIWEPTLNGAMAVAIPLSPRVELVPAVGLRWIRREFDSEAWYFGVGRYAVLAGVALRVRR